MRAVNNRKYEVITPGTGINLMAERDKCVPKKLRHELDWWYKNWTECLAATRELFVGLFEATSTVWQEWVSHTYSLSLSLLVV